MSLTITIPIPSLTGWATATVGLGIITAWSMLSGGSERQNIWLGGLALGSSWVTSALMIWTASTIGGGSGIALGTGGLMLVSCNAIALWLWAAMFAITHFGYGK